MIFKHGALSLQSNVYFNPLKLFDMLYIRKANSIRKFENNVILLNQENNAQNQV
jgi:hypothetical protein